MAYSGTQVTQLRPCGMPQAKPAGSFAGKAEAEVVVSEGSAAWYIVLKAGGNLCQF